MELTTSQLMQIFNVTQMTLYNWKEGRDKKKIGKLPAHARKAGKRHRVFYKWAEVKQWALKNNIPVVKTPKQVEGEKMSKLH
jgi:hypothetical protein